MAFSKFLVVPLLLTVAMLAKARVDFPNEVSGVSLYADSSLSCCDNCECDKDAGYCNCKEWIVNTCALGCKDCDCKETPGPYLCYCLDKLDSCPAKCHGVLKLKTGSSSS